MIAIGTKGPLALSLFLVLATGPAAGTASAADAVLELRATSTTGEAMTLSLFRWSTDADRALVLAAMAPPAQPARQGAPGGREGVPAAAPGGREGAPSADPGGRGGREAAPAAAAGGRGGRGAGGRAGGRGRGGAPASPAARLAAAVKAAPTVGFIWGGGVTGYSIKYSWRAPATGAPNRVVLIADRRMPAPPAPTTAAPNAEADFTVIEIRLDANGTGEGRSSLTGAVVIDQSAGTVALDDYAAAPAVFRIRR